MPNTVRALGNQQLDVHRDSADFRDLIYRPALIALQREIIPIVGYVRVRDQEKGGACTGFGLAAVIDYLNHSRYSRDIVDHFEKVSSRMLYEMAKHHDRWPGEAYDGSSARGAMKGWHKHGVCGEDDWPYSVASAGSLTALRQERALVNPLGAYYRILPNRTDVQSALNEVGAIFATAYVHSGWRRPQAGRIRFAAAGTPERLGGHAFAVLGYTEQGFIIQNSWGESWSSLELGGSIYRGLAVWSYADFDANLMDAWVARMARPVESVRVLSRGGDIAQTEAGPERVESGPPAVEIRDHYLHIDDGRFDPEGNYPSDDLQARELVKKAVTSDHLLLYAHGGLNTVKGSAHRVGKLTPVFEANGVHDLHFIWETDLLGELRDVLLGKQDFVKDRVGGLSSWWDRLLEKSTWPLGRPLWREMISDADIAFRARFNEGDRPAGSRTLDLIKRELTGAGRPRIHLVGHSAGAIWLARLLSRWHDLRGPRIDTLVLFAPACTHYIFLSHILPRLKDHTIERLRLFVLSDDKEKKDTVEKIYRKSLLYLVSNSYQKTRQELNGSGIPLLGMATYLPRLSSVLSPLRNRVAIYESGSDAETASDSHGGFDNDVATMNTMLSQILRGAPHREFVKDDLEF
ncbi:MAG: C1 family peptidase [Acidobacteriota bacterium]|nr:C1 family peptidase [Acidobacteriota bacterium]